MKKLLWIPAALLIAIVPAADAKMCVDCDICQANPELPECDKFLQGGTSAGESLWQSMINAFVSLF